MGNNQAYSFMEETVIGAYDLGVLDRKLLRVLMEPYRGTDIDSGGSANLKTKKGKLEVEDVVIAIMRPAVARKLAKVRAKAGDDAFYDARYKAFHDITSNVFGWRR